MVNIARKHYFGAFGRTGNNGLDLMGRKVLCLVHNKKRVRQTSSANVSQGRNLQSPALLHFFNILKLAGRNFGFVFQHGQVIEQGQHIRGQLFVYVARQKAHILILQRYHRTRNQNGLIVLGLGNGRRQSQEGFTRAGHTGKGHHRNIGVHERIQGKGLFVVARLNAAHVLLLNVLDAAARGPIHHRHFGRGRMQGKIFVQARLGVNIFGRKKTIGKQLGHHFFRHPDGFKAALFKAGFFARFVEQIIVGRHAKHLGLHAQVHVFGHQHHHPLRILFFDLQGYGENAVVGRVFHQSGFHFGGQTFTHHHLQLAQVFAQRHPAVKQAPARKTVHRPHNFTGIVVDLFVAFFETVQLFQNRQRQNKVVFLKLINRLVVVQEHIRIQDKNLGRFATYRFFRLCGAAFGLRCTGGTGVFFTGFHDDLFFTG